MAQRKKKINATKRGPKKPPVKGWRRVFGTPAFANRYAIAAVIVLLATTLFWAISSASLQLGNADQLVNPYLFASSATFHGALLPAAHSFLVKWPVFFLIKLFGFSGAAFTIFTVGLVIATVASLVLVMYRIERRPLVFGTLCLALASALLLVPAQPYAGGILPVNMAMIATRNLEYVLYIAGLVLFIRSPKLKSRGFWLGIGLMGLLVASDRLFLALSLGGALLALVAYALSRGWNLVSLSVDWLAGSIIAGAGAAGILWLLQAGKATHIIGQASAGASPYALAHSARDIALGIIYAVQGLLTNFGANPAYDATIVRNIPHQAYARLAGLGGPGFVVNALILVFGAFAVWRIMRASLKSNKGRAGKLDDTAKLSIMLVWSTLAAVGVFVTTSHYYAVDARYLSIALFAVFVSAATFARKQKWRPETIVACGAVILVGIAFGLMAAGRSYANDKSAMAGINERDKLVAQVLARHPVQVLVGDYWRVVPTKFVSGSKLDIMPLAGCTQPLDSLSSQSWQPDLRKHSFAYLLSLDRGLTNYPQCALKQIVTAYGRPNASTVIAGSLSQPKELLLFYDHGTRKSAPKTTPLPQGPATVVPISADQLSSNTSCAGPTVMNVVAHQDDDLLFMNPDLLHDLKAGHCVRTVYVTAGDAGAGRFYWLSREQGSEAAYSNMIGAKDLWIQRIVQLANNEFVTVATPSNNSKVSLVFMHLPDGNVKGDGFSASHNESLERLEAKKISLLHAVDGQSVYSSTQLTSAISSLMSVYQPTEIRTQANFVSHTYPDHSDHMAVGRYTQLAYAQYEKQQYEGLVTIPLQFYIGYPVHQMAANVSGADLQAKESAFLTYAGFDGNVCRTAQQCRQTPTYNAYLTRQYKTTADINY
jgi:LmbE family N-acetylglucosaminyl deacetylase